MPAGKHFTKMRRCVLRVFFSRYALPARLQQKMVQKYAPMLEKNPHNLVLKTLDNPEWHQDHAKRFFPRPFPSNSLSLTDPTTSYSTSVVMAIAYSETPHVYPVLAVNGCLRLSRLGINICSVVSKFNVFILRYLSRSSRSSRCLRIG